MCIWNFVLMYIFYSPKGNMKMCIVLLYFLINNKDTAYKLLKLEAMG